MTHRSQASLACSFAFFEIVRGLIDQLLRGFRSFPTKELDLLVIQLVGGDKELFNFLADLFGQFPRVVFSLLAMRIARYPDQAVIANFFACRLPSG